MNLHGQIMNILADATKAGTDDVRIAYLHGHRDARHAAAELALESDAEIERLRSALCEIANADMTTKGFNMMAIDALDGVPEAPRTDFERR